MLDLTWLPIDGRETLCRARDGQITPLADIPGEADLTCHGGGKPGWFAVCDARSTRVALYEMLSDAPWIRCVLPPLQLPPDCIAHAAMPLDDGVLVGGHSRSGEALWWRHAAQTEGAWQALEIPARLRVPGKAIDGLHRDGDRIIAVDDIVVPKWLLLYRVRPEGEPTRVRTVRLPSNTTYERIIHSCLGKDTLWLTSYGINHGRTAGFICGFDRKSFKRLACWSAAPLAGTPPLFSALSAVEWRDRLLVPCGDAGLVQMRLGQSEDLASVRAEAVPVDGLCSVSAVRCVPEGCGIGVFAVGKGPEDVRSAQWLPLAIFGS